MAKVIIINYFFFKYVSVHGKTILAPDIQGNYREVTGESPVIYGFYR